VPKDFDFGLSLMPGTPSTFIVRTKYITMNELEEFLGEQQSWRRAAFGIIRDIPNGFVATYGNISRQLGEQGFAITPRTIGWLRRQLYGFLGHESDFPLHRVACAGDARSLRDSEETRRINDQRRNEEGFFDNPQWLQ
jgi:alkylated DNA nucleotide flippase Atl1